MEISSQEREIPTQIQIPIPIPINTSYGGHMNILHDPAPQNHIIPTPAPTQNQIPSIVVPTSLEDNGAVPYKKMVRYRECLKNHAASMGGNATDGCGEFMPSGVEGTLEALICSACNCHRNFHRKEVEGEVVPYNSSSCECHFGPPPSLLNNNRVSNGRKLILGHHKGMLGPETLGYPTGTLIHSRPAHHQMMMSYNVGSIPSESDEQEGGGGYGGGGGMMGRPLPPPHLVKKRFRTKFSQEQKEKMLSFAEKVGWKIQKPEENVVQSFCQEIGVKRRVLKVWMHNNKHNLAKKIINSSSSDQNPI